MLDGCQRSVVLDLVAYEARARECETAFEMERHFVGGGVAAMQAAHERRKARKRPAQTLDEEMTTAAVRHSPSTLLMALLAYSTLSAAPRHPPCGVCVCGVCRAPWKRILIFFAYRFLFFSTYIFH